MNDHDHPMIDDTHDPALTSWVESANHPTTDFPIQNLPFGRFREPGRTAPLRIGVAIGDQVLDLEKAGLIETDDMNALMAASCAARRGRWNGCRRRTPMRSRHWRRSAGRWMRWPRRRRRWSGWCSGPGGRCSSRLWGRAKSTAEG